MDAKGFSPTLLVPASKHAPCAECLGSGMAGLIERGRLSSNRLGYWATSTSRKVLPLSKTFPILRPLSFYVYGVCMSMYDEAKQHTFVVSFSGTYNVALDAPKAIMYETVRRFLFSIGLLNSALAIPGCWFCRKSVDAGHV